MKIVFMGTPEYAAKALGALIEKHEVTAVITQPDKPVGRGGKVKFTPVKEIALNSGIEVYQPQKIKKPEFISILKTLDADVFIVAAYGQILSKEILDMPKYGSVNIHASLLPKYRGAAPIQQAIINGESETGITVMQMDEGIDTGDMLYKQIVPITDEDTGETLHDKLAEAGAEAILNALKLIEKGEAVPEKQDDSLSSYAKMLTKDMGNIDWAKPAVEIDRLIRALYPWPSAYSNLGEYGMVKIIKATPVAGNNNLSKPGTIVEVDKKKGLIVSTGEGCLLVEKIQTSGKKAMDVPAFLLGNKIEQGLIFG